MTENVEDSEDYAREFRERVFAAAEESIEHFTAPLFVEGNDEIVDHRSGVLIQIADMKFLVTAAHWMIHHHEQGRPLCIVMPEKGKPQIRLVYEKFWSTNDADEDICVTQLTDTTLGYIADYYKFARITDMMSRDDKWQHNGAYLIFGFPFAMARFDDEGGKAVESWRYLTVPYRGDYANVESYRPVLHLVLDYARKTHNREGGQVHPRGMSGCGIWFVGNPFTFIGKDNFKLAAIQNCWHKGHEYVKGTWIDNVLNIIWKYYPAARNAMKLHGIHF